MGEILVGTCSWTDPTLIESGRFYPPWARSAGARLQYYASQFPIVEVDSTYYALPGEKTSRLWVERTRDGFIFDIKAFRLFTLHPTPPQALPADIRQALPSGLKEKPGLYLHDLPEGLTDELWRRFEIALLPLDSAGRLGVVLFQFPPWFYPGSKQRDYILKCKERLRQYRIAVEFRHSSWLSGGNADPTLSFLRENDLPYGCVDEPQGFKSSMPPLAEATSDIGLVRFHGRNRETWEKKGLTTAERFNYLYSEDELREWVPRIKLLASITRQLHVLFNNCYSDRAVRNAGQMRRMLD
ncbi:MAG: DUF72 domain-containing protein [Dehalococcoidia bacterium]|nr:DUF72 domain-containing protein [Dehalococcoidia bacterium]